MESFYHTLKTELVRHEHYRTHAEARASLQIFRSGGCRPRIAALELRMAPLRAAPQHPCMDALSVLQHH